MVDHMISVVFFNFEQNRQLWVRLNWISRNGARAFPKELIEEIKKVSKPEEENYSRIFIKNSPKNENSRDEGVLTQTDDTVQSSEKTNSVNKEDSSSVLTNNNVLDKKDETDQIEKRIKISDMKLLDSVDFNTLVTGRCMLNWSNTCSGLAAHIAAFWKKSGGINQNRIQTIIWSSIVHRR